MSRLMTILHARYEHYKAMRKFGPQLRLAVDHTRRIRPNDVILVTCLRNELPRLPYFCDYYRRLGVNHFLIVDNDSTDGVQEWARGQEDVSVWHTKASYKASKFGMEWCNYLLLKFGVGKLCITVDPDEFLVYPMMQTRNLRDLGEFLKSEKRDVLHCLMLDAYSDKPLRETIYRSGDDPFETCPYFDMDGYTQTVTYHGGRYIRGGPRMRLHNSEQPENSPALNKIPVVWWRRNYRYTSSMHDLMPRRLSRVGDDPRPSVSGVLFHFKFVSSLSDKAAEEMHRKQHYAGSAEYKTYVSVADPLLYENGISARYQSPQQLIELGLMSRGNWF